MSSDDASINAENSNQADEEALKKLDETIAQEDPQFAQEMSEIEIDNSACHLVQEHSVASYQVVTAAFFSKENLLRTVDFKNNRRSVMLFWFSVLMVSSIVYFAFQTRFWDRKASLYLTSFADWKVQVADYNPLNDTLYFFDNPRLSKNIIELKKMVVNLKPSSDSSDNPMLAFSITIEGLSREAVIEIKDRESEFVDLAARVAEEYSYDELVSSEGKISLSEKIVDIYNANLTTGQVRRVMYSTFIIKN